MDTESGMTQCFQFVSISSVFCSPVNGGPVKVPPLYVSIFVPLYIQSLYSHTVRWQFLTVSKYIWSAHPVLIQLKRRDSIQHLENKVMQIASAEVFPVLSREGSNFLKVSFFKIAKIETRR